MDIINIINALGSSGVIIILIQRYYTNKDKQMNLSAITKDEIEEMKEHICIITNSLKEYNKNIDNLKTLTEIISKSEQAVLRDRIIQMYNHYYYDKLFFPIYARESLEQMFKEYKNLGGNGVVDNLVKSLLSLPVKLNSPSNDE